MSHRIPLFMPIWIGLLLLIGPFLPETVQAGLYALSLSIKACLLFVLPGLVFCLLFKAIVQLSERATHLFFLLLISVCASNFIATWLSHYVGEWVYHWQGGFAFPPAVIPLTPLWHFTLPSIISNGKAMGAGVFLGFLGAYWNRTLCLRVSRVLDKGVQFLLKSVCLVLPLFIAGFIVQWQAEGLITTVAKQYAFVGLVIIGAQSVYLAFLYLVVHYGDFIACGRALRNMIPAALTGLGTMSSASAMPLSLIAAEKNTKNRIVAETCVPATVNIHLIGDCLAIPILAYALLKTFGLPEPSLGSYFLFTLSFVLAKFSVAAVPGGGILVMLPLLESQLHFQAPMLSLITALYILFDPIITCANVLGNGVLVIFIDKIQAKCSNRVDWTPEIERNA